jgi:low molecular weight protein-tyrosine phosphatase
MTRQLLFLCTGNYYRSRFAELLFNAQALAVALPWRAESRGIALELGVDNRGPISAYATAGLRARGIALNTAVRYPRQVREGDLTQAERIIALDDTEHRPLLVHRFPHWVERVEFWHVPDFPRAPVVQALAEMDRQVCALIHTLLNDVSLSSPAKGQRR